MGNNGSDAIEVQPTETQSTKEPEKKESIYIVINLLSNGEVALTGNIPNSPVTGLGMLERAKQPLVSWYSQKMKTKQEILRPGTMSKQSWLNKIMGR